MAEYCKGDQPAPEGDVDNHVFKGDELASVGNNCKDIVLQIKSDMDKLSKEPSKLSIYRIPKALRETNEKAYTPIRVAIGPYHADNVALKPMEEHKLMYLKAFVSRSSRSRCTDETTKLNECFEAVARLEPAARRYYDGSITSLCHHDFTKMLLIDGAFIIEFFYMFFDSVSEGSFVDPILAGKARHEVCRDLILLENQIPYFILECLFELSPKLQRNNNRGVVTLGMLGYLCLGYHIPITSIDILDLEEVQRRAESSGGEVLHLVHLMRFFCFEAKHIDTTTASEEFSPSPQHIDTTTASEEFSPSPQHIDTTTASKEPPRKWFLPAICMRGLLLCKKPNSEPSQPFHLLAATELHESGIHFKKQASGRPSLNITFGDGIVQMPCIEVDDYTEMFFRNVMAFEQYHLHQYEVTNYMALLDDLIDTTKDVEVLEKSKVLIPSLESRDNVKMLFNSITHQTTFNDSQYSEVCKKLNEHAERPWNKWKATLRRDYFGSPWAIISLVAAVILLLLTVIQTIATVRSTKW